MKLISMVTKMTWVHLDSMSQQCQWHQVYNVGAPQAGEIKEICNFFVF